jgi:hypothetical protein
MSKFFMPLAVDNFLKYLVRYYLTKVYSVYALILLYRLLTAAFIY